MLPTSGWLETIFYIQIFSHSSDRSSTSIILCLRAIFLCLNLGAKLRLVVHICIPPLCVVSVCARCPLFGRFKRMMSPPALSVFSVHIFVSATSGWLMSPEAVLDRSTLARTLADLPLSFLPRLCYPLWAFLRGDIAKVLLRPHPLHVVREKCLSPQLSSMTPCHVLGSVSCRYVPRISTQRPG